MTNSKHAKENKIKDSCIQAVVVGIERRSTKGSTTCNREQELSLVSSYNNHHDDSVQAAGMNEPIQLQHLNSVKGNSSIQAYGLNEKGDHQF